MEQIIFALSSTLVHIPSMAIRYAPFHEFISKKRRVALFAVYAAVLLLIGVAYYRYGVNYTFLTHKIILLASAVVLPTINIVLLPFYWREHIFSSGLASLHVSATFYMCAYFVMRLDYLVLPTQIVAVSGVMTFVIFVLLSRVYLNSARRVITPFLSIDSQGYWKRVWFLPLPLFLASFFSCPLDTYYDDLYSFISRVLILVAAVLLSNAIAEDHKYMLSRLTLAEKLNSQDEYIHHLTEHVAEARKSRHDFKHHLSAVKRYIDTDDKSGLTEYWEELHKYVSTDIEIPYTGNTAFDGILYRYALLSKENRIKLEVTGVLEKIVMPDTDFSVLIGNALDNAFSGCMTLEYRRFITVQMRIDHDEQLICVSNSYDGVVNTRKDVLLSRRRINTHGIGIDSMKQICKKHGAIMDIRYDDDKFSVLFLIKTVHDKKKNI